MWAQNLSFELRALSQQMTDVKVDDQPVQMDRLGLPLCGLKKFASRKSSLRSEQYTESRLSG